MYDDLCPRCEIGSIKYSNRTPKSIRNRYIAGWIMVGLVVISIFVGMVLKFIAEIPEIQGEIIFVLLVVVVICFHFGSTLVEYADSKVLHCNYCKYQEG